MCTHGLFQAATCMHFPRMIRHQYFQFRSGTSQIRKMNRYHHLQVKKKNIQLVVVCNGFPVVICWTELTNLAFIKVGDVTLRDDIDLQTASNSGTLPLSFLDKSLVNSLPRRWEFTAVEVDLHCCRSPCMNRNPPVPKGENQPSTLLKGIPKGGKVD